MNKDPLITYFNNITPLNDREKTFVSDSFSERILKRREFILQPGDICKHTTFVVQGCLKMYCVDEHAKEHNLQFAIENWWIGDIYSFHQEVPSKLYIETIEKSVLLQIEKSDQLKLFEEHPKFNKIFRLMAENAMVSLQYRILQNISYSAEERYLTFMKKYPDLFRRISNVQIASYLGVTPEFLSAVRKKLAAK